MWNANVSWQDCGEINWGEKMKLTLRQRFLIAVIFSIPLLVLMFLMLGHIMIGGADWLSFGCTTIILLFAAGPFYRSAWAALKLHHANMDTLVAIGTATAYLYSVYALLTKHAVFFESAAFIVVFILLGQVLEEHMKQKAASAVDQLLDLQAPTALLQQNGHWQEVPLATLQVGDVVLVKPGTKVPLDGQIIQGTSTIDESLVTGESLPVTKTVGDQVIGATINGNNSLEVQIQKVGEQTFLAQIITLVKQAQTSRAPIQKLTDRISNVFVPVVLIVALLTFWVWSVVLKASITQALTYAVSVIIVACPCALGLATPTALMVGTGLGAKAGILIKNGTVLEDVNRVQTLVFDKTGTITEGHPRVVEVLGNRSQVLQLAATLESQSNHPLAQAIVTQARQEQITPLAATGIQTLPGLGLQGVVEDQSVLIGSEDLFTQAQNPWSQELSRLKQEAKTLVLVGTSQQVQGVIALQDPPKANAQAVFHWLKQHHYQTVMLTGDNSSVAQAVGQQVGVQQVIAQVLPKQKAQTIAQLQKQNAVAFIGDGINDAPALTQADVGIAMGSGTDVAIAAGGIVLLKNDLQDVIRALVLSQKIFRRIKANLFWAFIYNLLGIPIAAGCFSFWGLSLSPVLAGLAMALSSLSVVTSSVLLNYTSLKLSLTEES